jgi:uncharacterized membrane protein YGL010W
MRLLQRQWSEYSSAHQDRRNLLIHLVTMPFFALGVALVPVGIARGSVWLALAGLLLLFVVMALQGRGHSLEARRPAPFRGPLDVLARIFAEQLVTFPRFVLSGAFFRAWRAGADDATAAR